MAATNVQAFPGDVTISSNLAVDTNTLFVDSVGNKVGIGTTNPQEALHVAGSMRLGAAEGVDDDNLRSIVSTSPLEVHSNAEDLDGLGVNLNLRSGFSDSESNIQMLSSKSNTTFQYISFATATTERMRITTAGNVGIGVTNPGTRFAVQSGGDTKLRITSATTGNSVLEMGDSDDYDAGRIDYDNNNNWMSIYTAAGNRMRIDASGYTTIGAYVQSPRTFIDTTAHYAPDNIPLLIHGGSGGSTSESGNCGIGFNTRYRKQHIKNAIFCEASSWGRGNIHFCSKNTAGSGAESDKVAVTDSRMHVVYDGRIGLGSSFTSPAKVYVKTEANASLGGSWSPGDFVVSHGVGYNAPSQSLGVGIGVDYGGDSSTSKGHIWCMRPNQTWNTLKLLANKLELIAFSSVTLNGGANVTSDDRLKTDEYLIKNATSTLMKLKPQTYNKHKNLPNSKDEQQVDNAGIPYNKAVMEAGLIVQDVYYDAPELKHLVLLSDDAIPRETKPEEPVPGDIQQDPDYSDWGVDPSGLNYTGLTPYIIKSIQEINTELPRHKTKIDGIPFSNISAYHNLIVSKDSAVRLANTYNDKTVYGVISETEASTDDSEVLVNYQGDGKVWVINTSNIEAGDYITTSNVGGYGMKQGTDFTMNYTLAKSTIACDFTQPHIAEKRKIQELQDVTYWSVTTNVDISKKRYDFIASNNVNLVSTTAEIHYSNVSVEELTGNSVYSNITTQEYSNIDSVQQNNYTEVSVTKYNFISTKEYSLDPHNGTSNVIVRQEYVDVLDGNGQLQWEDTGNTVSMYELRYINSDGIQIDAANAVYKAALIDCTFKTG